MAEGRIRWKKGDYISLGRAVSQFNKKINELNKEEKKLYLPELENYQELKEEITTRKELNRVINSLRRFQKEGAEDLYITESGERLSKWERRELGIQSRIAQTRLRRELKELNEPLENGYSRAQMGSTRVKEIEAQIKNLKQIENKQGYAFNKLKSRLKNVGTSDFNMKRSIVYRENYIKEMEKYKDLDNYDKLLKFFEKYKNPLKFYEAVSQNELTKDLTYQSDEYFTQQAFNSFLEDLGIDIEEDTIS